MKKRYFKPETTVVTVRTQQLMQTSGKKMIGEGISKQQTPDTDDDDPNRSREDFRSDWEDEEEDF